jgi:hypothetical protein
LACLGAGDLKAPPVLCNPAGRAGAGASPAARRVCGARVRRGPEERS